MDIHRDVLVVELDVSDLRQSVKFYSSLGFSVAIDRPDRKFAYLTRARCVDVMLQAADGPGERLRIANLEPPFGRGICMLIPCPDVDALYSEFVAGGGQPLTEIHERHYDIDVLAPTARWPVSGTRHVVNRQFVVADPDGYLLRIYTEGHREDVSQASRQ